MLKAIIKSKNFGFWVIIHAIMGIGASFSSIIFGIWFFAFAISSIAYLNKGTADERKVNLLYLISYLASSELISRMGRGYNYKIPWELGKYVMIFGFLYGILVLQGRKGLLGLVMFFLLLPSIFLGPETTGETAELVGNIFGPIALGIGVFYCTDLKITRAQIVKMMQLILLPCVGVLAFTLIRNPDFSSYEFTLGANFQTAGNFGSNQVSTVLGLGAFLSFLFWINDWPLFNKKIYTLILFGLFTVQGLLTFSRGGMIGALVGIIVLAYAYSKVAPRVRKQFTTPRISGVIIGGGIALFVLFSAANAITGGVLELRYSGETNATLRGTREKDLNVLTTNRYDIFLADIKIWQQYFVLGAGVGGSEFLRSQAGFDYGGQAVAAHVELSRLLAEHGILGLFYFVILLVLGWRVFTNNRGNPKYTALLLALYAIALYTTFHAATRTFITPLLISLSTVKIVDINEPDTF
jgi:O-antigen ligase